MSSGMVGCTVVWQGRWWKVTGTNRTGTKLFLEDYYGMGETTTAPALKVMLADQ